MFGLLVVVCYAGTLHSLREQAGKSADKFLVPRQLELSHCVEYAVGQLVVERVFLVAV